MIASAAAASRAGPSRSGSRAPKRRTDEDDRAVERQGGPGPVDAQDLGVQRDERQEPGHPPGRAQDEDPGQDRRGVEQPPARTLSRRPPAPTDRPRLGDEDREEAAPRRDSTAAPIQTGGYDPSPEEPLAEDRPDGHAQPQRERPEADRLAGPALRREVGGRGEHRHDERRLADPEQRPDRDERAEGLRPGASAPWRPR